MSFKKSSADIKFVRNCVQVIPWNYDFPDDDKKALEKFDWISLEYGPVMFRGKSQIREYLNMTLQGDEEFCRYCLEVIITTLFDDYEFDIIGYDEATGGYSRNYAKYKPFMYEIIEQLENSVLFEK